jgi:hypothetical protein
MKKQKVRLPRVANLLRPHRMKPPARGAGARSAAADDAVDDSQIYRAPTGSSQDQVGLDDQADAGGASGAMQDYRKGGPVRAARKSRADDGGAGACGGGAGASFPRQPR